MDKKMVNPWAWQNGFGFSQANEVTGAQRILFCAGQTSNDAEGHPLHPGDIRAQTSTAFDNLETTLQAAGFSLSDVVRLTYYTTEMDMLLQNYDVIVTRLAAASCQPASTLLGVTRLAYPEWMIEIEATAVK